MPCSDGPTRRAHDRSWTPPMPPWRGSRRSEAPAPASRRRVRMLVVTRRPSVPSDDSAARAHAIGLPGDGFRAVSGLPARRPAAPAGGDLRAGLRVRGTARAVRRLRAAAPRVGLGPPPVGPADGPAQRARRAPADRRRAREPPGRRRTVGRPGPHRPRRPRRGARDRAPRRRRDATAHPEPRAGDPGRQLPDRRTPACAPGQGPDREPGGSPGDGAADRRLDRVLVGRPADPAGDRHADRQPASGGLDPRGHRRGSPGGGAQALTAPGDRDGLNRRLGATTTHVRRAWHARPAMQPGPFVSSLLPGGVLVLDGGLATQLEAQGADLSDRLWSARLLAEDPEAIVRAHLAYFRAGARVATTASYQATFEGFAARGLAHDEAVGLLGRSVDLADRARQRAASEGVNGPLFIAASIGPYGAMLADGSEYRGRYGLT